MSMKFLLALVLVFGFIVAVEAQNKEKSFILSGTIFDPNKAVVPDVEVTFENQVGKFFKTLSTEEGIYKISIPYGKYTIEFNRAGFRTLKIINFQNTFMSKKKLNANLVVRFCDDCNGDILGVENEDKRKPVIIDFSKIDTNNRKSEKRPKNDPF